MLPREVMFVAVSVVRLYHFDFVFALTNCFGGRSLWVFFGYLNFVHLAHVVIFAGGMRVRIHTEDHRLKAPLYLSDSGIHLPPSP
jgi:hypothetical protein